MNRRTYSMATRAAQAETTRARIAAAARERLDSPDGDVTLESVAAAAGVSVRTVLRAFGSREGLFMAAIASMREDTQRAVDDLPSTSAERVTRLFDDYESIGDRVLRLLAEEHRIAGFEALADEGRHRHREWVLAAFGSRLRGLRGATRAAAADALVAATDVYVWKLLRRDLGRSRAESERVVLLLIESIGTPQPKE